MAEEKKKAAFDPMIIGLVAVVVILVVGVIVFANESPDRETTEQETSSPEEAGQQAEETESPETGEEEETPEVVVPETGGSEIDLEELVDDDPHVGSLSAPVTIVAFSDYLCSYCRSFEATTLQEIGENYISNGDVRFVFRDMVVHGDTAQLMHEAGECADDQGMFWQYHDKLVTGDYRGEDKLKQLAVDLGLDSEEFDECLDSRKYQSEVEADTEAGSEYGVSGTPTFFINGKKLVGAQPYETFEQIIQAELAA